MPTNYNEIRKLFNYYIREYYYQKSKGTYFVHIKKPGILFTSLKFYKKKKALFPNIYDWYFENLSVFKKNKDILHYDNNYNIKNIYSYKINNGKGKREKNDAETGDIYINNSEQCLENIYKTSNLYYNMNPVYLSKICLYDLNDFHILFSNNYYDAFMQFYYSIISYKIDLNDIKIFPNLKILISHIKNVSNIINDELIKNTYIYLIKQKKMFNEEYIRSIFNSIYSVMLHNCPLYLFVDNSEQFRIILNFINKNEVKNIFESALPYPYYLIVDDNINIYNLQEFNIYLKQIFNKNLKRPFYSAAKENISSTSEDAVNHSPLGNNRNVPNSNSNSTTTSTDTTHMTTFIATSATTTIATNMATVTTTINTTPNNNSDSKTGKNIHCVDTLSSNREKPQVVPKRGNNKIYFFKLIKIFVMKPNYRFIEKI
ncbi:conserved Plasmodium protein, unknown function [Plasmodium malariae]|uniref:Uncharacterized protein n=1 Tax=Plasmodium malariae TaxID=5858 RepID=A0A1C3KCW3_PLAMA|nr:conserved Plasmodium protein, unknown function [Plasmodium malariae]